MLLIRLRNHHAVDRLLARPPTSNATVCWYLTPLRPSPDRLACGAIAGAASCVCIYPLEIAKTRMSVASPELYQVSRVLPKLLGCPFHWLLSMT